MLLALPVLVAQAAPSTLPLPGQPDTFTFVNDESVPAYDDQPGQKDLSAHAVATPNVGDLYVAWKWDVTSLTGGNTGDACALFDTDADARVNYSVCVTIGGSPATQLTDSPRVYMCGDTKVATCPGSERKADIQTVCGTGSTEDPFAAVNAHKKTEKPPGGDPTNDTLAVCKIAAIDFGPDAGVAQLINTCSYPSQSPTSDPSDCVLIPRDAFLRVTKITTATPNPPPVFDFNLATQGEAGGGACRPRSMTSPAPTRPGLTTGFVGIRSDKKYDLTEVNLPAGWAIEGAPSCANTLGTADALGTGSASTKSVTGIDAKPDGQITCTFRNKQELGAIRITKQRTGGTPKLTGAHFTIDGSGDYVTGADGTVCVSGLLFGNHEVVETQAPNGHSLPADASETVNVSAAATCTTGHAGDGDIQRPARERVGHGQQVRPGQRAARGRGLQAVRGQRRRADVRRQRHRHGQDLHRDGHDGPVHVLQRRARQVRRGRGDGAGRLRRR